MTPSFDEPPLVTSDTNIYYTLTGVKKSKKTKMTTWWHHPTILTLRFDRRLALRVSCILLLCIALITTLFFGAITRATPGINQTIGFQGRLLDSNGDIVHDGYYNMQFKIYQGGSGTAAGNPDGTLKWTETYVNNGSATGAVEVKNGFLSVNLGSVNPFGSSVDWNQDTLWLSMNVAGSSTSCTTFNTSPCVADGEMLPMKRLTSTPYSLNSGLLGGIASSGYIQNTTTAQTADMNITGTAQANIIQGTTSVLAPTVDTSITNGTLDIGTDNSLALNIGRSGTADSTISIGTGGGNRTLTLGSTTGTSSTTIQGGDGGVVVNTTSNVGFTIHDNGNNYNPLTMAYGSFNFNLGSSAYLRINDNTSGNSVLEVAADGTILTGYTSTFTVRGSAEFKNGITIQGTSGYLSYVTPGGASLKTAINIPNYRLGSYETILALGVQSDSAATARGILIADGRTTGHQATIGVLSPDENAIMGLSWNGSNSTGALSNTANTLALQGNGLNLLTATNNGGAANVGIGNSAAAGYALDVTGDINTSTAYRISGVSTLTNSGLNFSAASTAAIASASGQLLDIDGKTGVNIKNNGTTVATFGTTNIQIGTGAGTGTPTLLTVDKGSSAPGVTGDAYLGSMYYDTTIGKLQCYEADGWGACSANPDTFVSLSPQYANAVMHTVGPGTMTTDFCSDDLDINDGSSSQPTVCGTHETYNYYNWTSSDGADQVRSIYVTYQLPSNFGGFVSGSTSLMGRTDSTDAAVSYRVYRKDGSGLEACGTGGTSVSTGAQTTWQQGLASTQDPADCSFAAGDSIVFKINLDSANNADAYASNLNFAYKNSSN
jgi:hypothetical protein